jgi:predicted metal-binding membrane protein
MTSMRSPEAVRGRADRLLSGAVALVFLASAAVTVAWCGSMDSMPGMAMPGGWTMSMAWMRMPGRGWPAAAASFLGMWTVMMVAMMLPVLVPTLRGARRARRCTMIIAGGYFAAWLLLGAALFPAGVVVAAIAMQFESVSRLFPFATGLALIVAGAMQWSAWKARVLERCHLRGECCADGGMADAWRRGMALGGRCVRCCAPWTVVLLVLGVMDLGVMTLVAVAIGCERLLPRGERIARFAGLVTVAGGVLVLTT